MKRCTACLMPETRPRITFDDDGVCNACRWAAEKRRIDWAPRRAELTKFCERFRSTNGRFDCIVPVSGGKDSSYVAYKMKHELGMHPLCVNIVPPLAFDVGTKNLESFNATGYDCLLISPNPVVARRIARRGLIQYGQPLMAWMTNVQVGILRTAVQFDVPFIMFGEEGETEYGGTGKLKQSATYDVEDSIKIYLSGIDPEQYRDEFTAQELYWWTYPSADEVRRAGLAVTHWSYFENWDPYTHYLVAKDKCGLAEKAAASLGTYNNFSQTDTCLYDLHTYLMYLKFGFGRSTADVGIDIRRDAMTRKQGVELVKRFDGIFPEQFVGKYLEYFEMSETEFDAVLDRWANKDLFEKVDRRWRRTFDVA